MFSRFHRLRLNKECPFEAIFPSVVPRDMEECCQVFLLTLHISIEQRNVTFPSTPEYIIRPTQRDRSVNGVLYLCTCPTYHVEIRIRGGTIHVAWMRK